MADSALVRQYCKRGLQENSIEPWLKCSKRHKFVIAGPIHGVNCAGESAKYQIRSPTDSHGAPPSRMFCPAGSLNKGAFSALAKSGKLDT